ncbi:MAG: hypothetical protein KatS3mg031_2880 [Chitinophagales bacterium]|nr:MAG: hypothetical protein KatS3mg031_2880 [Chitinophagales bacterium]
MKTAVKFDFIQARGNLSKHVTPEMLANYVDKAERELGTFYDKSSLVLGDALNGVSIEQAVVVDATHIQLNTPVAVGDALVLSGTDAAFRNVVSVSGTTVEVDTPLTGDVYLYAVLPGNDAEAIINFVAFRALADYTLMGSMQSSSTGFVRKVTEQSMPATAEELRALRRYFLDEADYYAKRLTDKGDRINVNVNIKPVYPSKIIKKNYLL